MSESIPDMTDYPSSVKPQRKIFPDGRRVEDLGGSRFARLTVLEYAGCQIGRSRQYLWICRCECGTIRKCDAHNLKSGRSKSCGCLCRERTRLAKTTHGMSKNKAWKRNYAKANYLKTKEGKKAYNDEYRKLNRAQINAKLRAYGAANKSRRAANNRRKYRSDPQFRLTSLLRSHANRIGKAKAGGSQMLLGCTWEQAKRHIEQQFKRGMSWKNAGAEWHIDHIIPLAKFDLTEPKQQRLACHYSNLRPLWKAENMRKRANLEKHEQFSLHITYA